MNNNLFDLQVKKTLQGMELKYLSNLGEFVSYFFLNF